MEQENRWQTIIRELVDFADMNHKQIADLVGIAESGISRIRAGDTTRVAFDVGSKLIALHRAKRTLIRARAAQLVEIAKEAIENTGRPA